VSSNTASFSGSGVSLVQDSAGNGAAAPLSYIGGGTGNGITFPESYATNGSPLSVCTVSRYTSTNTAYQARIFQGMSGINWLHGCDPALPPLATRPPVPRPCLPQCRQLQARSTSRLPAHSGAQALE